MFGAISLIGCSFSSDTTELPQPDPRGKTVRPIFDAGFNATRTLDPGAAEKTIPDADRSSGDAAGLSEQDAAISRPSTCEPNTSRCVGPIFQNCLSDGSGWVDSAICNDSEHCDDATGCLPAKVCSPGTVRCAGGLLQRCLLSGAGYSDIEQCSLDERCDSEQVACVPNERCKPGAIRCDGQTVEICLEGGSFQELRSCLPAETCNPSSGECEPVDESSVLIVPDDSGRVSEGPASDVGIKGSWLPYNDCPDATAAGVPCTTQAIGDLEQDVASCMQTDSCEFTNTGGVMCTKGATAKVAEGPDGSPLFGVQWGAGIRLDLNTDGATPGPWDAVAQGIIGFSFDITFNAPGEVRVHYANPGLVDTHFKLLNQSGITTVLWEDVAQGSWVNEGRTDFNPEELLSIRFQVSSSTAHAVAFDFCVSNLRALKEIKPTLNAP